MTLKPNPKPVQIAERGIFRLCFFFGKRKSFEQILKVKEIYGKVTKAGKSMVTTRSHKVQLGIFL